MKQSGSICGGDYGATGHPCDRTGVWREVAGATVPTENDVGAVVLLLRQGRLSPVAK